MVHGQPFVAVRSPAFDLPAGDLPALYEQWCLLEVARVLASKGGVVEQQFVEPEEHEHATGRQVAWRVRLLEDRPLLRARRGDGEELTLTYQRRFRPREGHGTGFGSLDPFLRVPDIVIERDRPGRPPALLVFDAKYRVEPDGGIPEEALGDAYTYHAALGHAGRRVSSGVFLLFPGSAGFAQDAVGALPLSPGKTGALDAVVDRWLQEPA
jgi:large subunit ribosomal protein MRP49